MRASGFRLAWGLPGPLVSLERRLLWVATIAGGEPAAKLWDVHASATAREEKDKPA